MKKFSAAVAVAAALIVLAMLVLATPALASSSAKTSVPTGASFELVENDALTPPGFGVPGGQFYLYSPSNPYQWATLTREDNSVLFVYPDVPYPTEQAAWKAMVDTGLVSLAEQNAIYVVMPLPLSGDSWTEDDVSLYSGIQFWLFGGLSAPPFLQWTFEPLRAGNSKTYMMGEGSGATFINDVMSKNAKRIAGILTFGGTMTDFTPGLPIPAYLVQADQATVDYYKSANGTDSQPSPGRFVNSGYPLKTVIVADRGQAAPFKSFNPRLIGDAWSKIFSRTARVNIDGAMMLTDSEWILNDRPNYEALGITRVDHYAEALPDGTVSTWFDYVPKVAKHGNAPLVIVLHGLNGDPIDTAESTGFVNKAAQEGFIVITPAYVAPNQNVMLDPATGEHVILQILEYAKTSYHIDASRVYLTGYSMGGYSACKFGLQNASEFAAIGVMGFDGVSDPEVVAAVAAQKDDLDLPFMILRGARDMGVTEIGGNPAIPGFATAGLPMLDMNELPHDTPDYAANPYWGFPTTDASVQVSKGLHFDVSYMYKNGEALAKFVLFEEGSHTHEDYYATLAWDFFSQFSR